MEKLFLWLKRLFSANFIIIVLTALSAWLAYKQFSGNLGGKVVPVFYSSEKENGNHCTLICKTNDTISLTYPQLFPQFKNISKRAIRNFRLEYTIVSPLQDPYFQFIKYETNSPFSATPPEVDVMNGLFRTKYTYKTDMLFAQEETPCLIKRLEFLPIQEVDSFYRNFAIECKISWDGKKDVSEYISYVNFRDFPDDKPFDKRVSQDSLFIVFYDWAYPIYQTINGSVTSMTDLLLAYHLQSDSTGFSGTYSLLKDINIADIDSLCLENYPQTHPQFLYNHLYGTYQQKNREKIDWMAIIAGIFSFLLAILFFALFINSKKNKASVLEQINLCLGSLFFLSGSLWCCESVIWHFELSRGATCIRLFVLLLAIISAFYAVELIFFLFKNLFKRKSSSIFMHQEKKDIELIVCLALTAAFMIGCCYISIDYLL